MRGALATAAALGWMVACTVGALGHEASVPFADWYNSRKMPEHPGTSCCGVGDAADVDELWLDPDVPGGFIVRVEGWQLKVPPEKVGWEDVNPTGRAAVFIGRKEDGSTPSVYCFFPASGT